MREELFRVSNGSHGGSVARDTDRAPCRGGDLELDKLISVMVYKCGDKHALNRERPVGTILKNMSTLFTGGPWLGQ